MRSRDVAGAAGVGDAQLHQRQEPFGSEVAQGRARGAQRLEEDLQRREEARCPGWAGEPGGRPRSRSPARRSPLPPPPGPDPPRV